MSDIRAYGSWPSPISAADVAAAGRRFSDLRIDRAPGADSNTLYWIESRPDEGGRNTIMKRDGEQSTSLLDAPLGARSAVHEYGGAAFTVHDGRVWFCNADDQAIWTRDAEGRLEPLTAAGSEARFADLQYDAVHARLIAVVESPQTESRQPRASIESIDADGTRRVIAQGHDFYASPRLSPGGDRLVWLAWNHPHMPWDITELWQAEIDEQGHIGAPVCLWAPAAASLFAPTFDPDGRLYVVCDQDNWWNIHRQNDDARFTQLTFEDGEFGLPQWVFGQSTYGFTDEGRLFALLTRDGVWELGEVDIDTGRFRALALEYDFFEQLCPMRHRLAVIAANAATPKSIVWMEAARGVSEPPVEVVRAGDGLAGEARLSSPQAMTWASGDGAQAHGLYYPPASRDFRGPSGARPPLILKCHGGPTGATSTALDPRIQYWTSRGYGLLDVNYRGSTGYGRAYRRQLEGVWGIADVEDCQSGARHLARRGLVDPERVVITGSSAGGYTVLCVLTFTDIAAAGVSYYGIGDLSGLLASTHKFESRYLDGLIGTDPAVFEARSPLVHARRLSCPVLFLQGMKDRVVPPDQAQAMADALRSQGIAVAHVCFANERHGFREAANIVTAIESERAFYTRVLGIEGVDDLLALTIDNFTG